MASGVLGCLQDGNHGILTEGTSFFVGQLQTVWGHSLPRYVVMGSISRDGYHHSTLLR